MGEGRAARKAGGAVGYAAVRYRNTARAAGPLSRTRRPGSGPESCSAPPPDTLSG